MIRVTSNGASTTLAKKCRVEILSCRRNILGSKTPIINRTYPKRTIGDNLILQQQKTAY